MIPEPQAYYTIVALSQDGQRIDSYIPASTWSKYYERKKMYDDEWHKKYTEDPDKVNITWNVYGLRQVIEHLAEYRENHPGKLFAVKLTTEIYLEL